MLTPDPKQPLPKFPSDFLRMCQEISVKEISPHHLLGLPLWRRLQDTFANTFLCGLELPSHPILDWYGSRHKLGGYKNDGMPFFEHLFLKEDVRHAMNDFQLPLELKLNLERSNSFVLDGQLASVLVSGGAYGQLVTEANGDSRTVKLMTDEFCNTLFEHRYEEVDVFFCNYAWSSWFYDIAWDCSFFIVDRRYRRIWILCWTDTD